MSQRGSPVTWMAPADALGAEVAAARSVGAKRTSASRSVSTRFRSSGIPSRYERSPASTCTSGSPAARPHARRTASRSCRPGRRPRRAPPARSRRASRSSAERQLLGVRARADLEVVVGFGQLGREDLRLRHARRRSAGRCARGSRPRRPNAAETLAAWMISGRAPITDRSPQLSPHEAASTGRSSLPRCRGSRGRVLFRIEDER